MILYRSDCLWHVRGKPIATWSTWSFEPVEPERLDRGGDRRFVRCDALPVAVSAPAPAKVVAGRLVHAGDPWEQWPAEMVWILARDRRRGLRLER